MSKAKRYIKRAREYFLTGDYQNSLLNYSLAMREEPSLKEARVGALLCDLATEREEEACSLYDYYDVIKESEAEADEILEEIIESIDYNFEKISLMFDGIFDEREEVENGIEYDDFILIVGKRGSFKRAFEDIMFSTKVLIRKKDDFYDFLEKLIESGYKEMAYSYLENAAALFPSDSRIRKLYEKIEEKD